MTLDDEYKIFCLVQDVVYYFSMYSLFLNTKNSTIS